MENRKRLNLYDFTPEELGFHLTAHGFKTYNSLQIFEWVYQKKQTDFMEMSNLSKALRNHLSEYFELYVPEVHTKQESSDGTIKFLLKLADGFLIETVLMRHDYGLSLCVTSQVGCNMGCAFCASGLKKRQRNLTIGELVGQLIAVRNNLLIDITHVVVMGTGEPFDNYDNIIKFVRIINENKGMAIGQRHITISTAGIVPMIYKYALEPIRSNLAVSLHAPNDDLRLKLMPLNKKYPLTKLIEACAYYFEKTSRRITFEYILLSGINDSVDLADELSDLLRGLNCYVNIIPYNQVDEFGFKVTVIDRALKFMDRLMKRGINVTMRKEQGGDIAAACGQLRLKSDK